MTNERLPYKTIFPNFFAKVAVQEYKSEAIRAIFDLLPIVTELGDIETAEKLLKRAEEYAGDDTASIKRLQCIGWCAMLSAAGRKGEIGTVVDKLPRLCRVNAQAAESVISSFSLQFLADLLEFSSEFDQLATALVATGRLRKQMDKLVSQIRAGSAAPRDVDIAIREDMEGYRRRSARGGS